MANQTSDRQRMSNELRELAKLAKPASGQPASRFPSPTEGSGYFDLEALLASGSAWPEGEVAAAPTSVVPALARAASRPVAVPSHERTAPGVSEETRAAPSARGRKALYALFSLASIGVVGYLAVTLARHPPPPAVAAPEAPAAAVVAPTSTTDSVTQPTAAAAPTVTVTAPAAVDDSTTPSAADVAPATGKSTRKPPPFAARAHVAPSGPAPSPAVVPAAPPARGNDSLMDLIKKSVATGK
jgi:hypothetical protein